MKWLFRIAATLVTLVVVAVAVLFLIPAERVAGLAADQFEAATGRSLTIEGPVRATLWPRLGVRAQGIRIANAEWSDRGPLLEADALEVGVALSSVMGDTVQVESLVIDGARLTLERRVDGSANWDFDTPPSDATASSNSGGSSRDIAIDRAMLRGAEITWVDQQAGTDLNLRAVDVTATTEGDALALDLSALLNGQAVSLNASVAGLEPLLDGALTPVTAMISAGESRITIEGRADIDPTSFEGRIDARSSDRFAALAALDIAPPDLPQGLGQGAIGFEAALTLAPAGTLHLRDMVLELDRNRLSGALDIDPSGDRPRISGSLAADALDLTGLSREGQGGETALVAEAGWGQEAIDVSGLFAADADLTFASGTITLGDATLDELRARVTLDNGRAVLTFQPLLAYGGSVTGDVVINGRGGLSSRANLDLQGLQMQPFLTEFADFDRLVGQADLSLRLLGVGATAQALMDSLEGSASVAMGQGELLGLDIGGMVRTLDLGFRGEGQKTIFDGLSGSWTVTNGVARGEDFQLDAPYLAVSASGDIDLGAQTLDYSLLPTLRRDAREDGFTVPILMDGPWSDPRIRPDLEALARQRLAVTAREEAARLEERVREEAEAARRAAEDAARQRLAEELDVEAESLDSREAIEDAIRNRVESELLDLLGNR